MNLPIKVSTWAKQNPWQARMLLLASHLLLNIFAITLGLILTQLGIMLPEYTLMSGVFIFSVGLTIYPIKAEKRVRYSKIQFYKRQKLADLMLAGATFIMVLQMGNEYFKHEVKPVNKVWSYAAQACYVKVIKPENVTSPISPLSEKQDKKNITNKKEKTSSLNSKIRTLRSYINNISEGRKIGLGILLILGSVWLSFLVVGLACNLSCSGAEGAAIMVGILGSAAVVFLLLKAFKMMSKKKNEAMP